MAAAAARVYKHEEEADAISRDVLLLVRRSFITPFDRGDIKDLINTIDQMKKTAQAVVLFEVECAEAAGSITLFAATHLGVPVSTTQTTTGAIVGVGAAKRASAVRWGVTLNLIWAWILTIPISALLAGGIYALTRLF